jgi:Nuclease-related domain/AAA domain
VSTPDVIAVPRLIHPSKAELAQRRVLNAGETKVLDSLDRALHWGWEIYAQPHLNGLRPDFVLLHPDGRAVAIEVKDWTFDTWSIQWRTRPDSAPIPVGRLGERRLTQRNPLEQVLNYRSEIAKHYSVAPDGRPGPVDVALVFPFARREAIIDSLAPALEHRRSNSVALLGAEELADLDQLETMVCSSSTSGPSEAVAHLREWLVGPSEVIATEPVPLTPRQRELITSRTSGGYRRVRGAAGSGKSLVLAARAAHLAREGKDVLVVSFNHTLTSYLRTIAQSFGADSRHITWLGFHEWCARVMADTGRWPMYQALWSGNHSTHAVLNSELPRVVAEALDADPDELAERYDAILVDEGQDFLPDWWDCLRRVCRSDGEMVLAADPAQDIFGRASNWTEGRMSGAGFVGKWADLGVSHRMPLPLIPLARSFAQQFLPEAEALLPEEPRQLRLNIDTCSLRWVQTSESQLLEDAVEETKRTLAAAVGQGVKLHTPGNFVLLTDANARGRELVAQLDVAGFDFAHTFASSSQEQRAAKKAFFLGGPRPGATTAHSFKGWESPVIVVCIARGNSQQALSLLYSAMTRLKANERGSYLTVVSSEARLSTYGRSSPDFSARS